MAKSNPKKPEQVHHEFDFLMSKYRLIYDLLKLDIEIANRNFQIFIGVQSAAIGLWAYGYKEASTVILIFTSIIGLASSLVQRLLHLKSRMFGEFRKQHMRDVEEEIRRKNGFDLEIFTLDRKVFGPMVEKDGHEFKNTRERFPPRKMQNLYKDFGRKSLMKYQEVFFLVALGLWLILLTISVIKLVNNAIT